MAGGRGRIFDFLILAAVMALSGPAAAHFSAHPDPDDIPGAKFDLRHVSLAEEERRDGTPSLAVELWTVGKFHRDDFRWDGDGRPFFIANLDTRGDRDIDFSVIMGVNDDGTYCQIQPTNGNRFKSGRPGMDPGYFRCRFARRKVNPDGTHIRWKIWSFSRRDDVDNAPDRGWFIH
jgi:hypothetical protein